MDHQGSQDDFWGSLMGRTTSEGQQIAELKGEVLKLKNEVAEQQKVMENLTDCIQTLTVEISNLVTTVNGTKEARKQRGGPSKPATRAFSDFEVPLSTLLGRLVTKGILRPLKPVPPPNPLPRGYKAFRYCEFHQGAGHDTDSCLRLRHEIEDLIQWGIIPPPPIRPNVTAATIPDASPSESIYI